jgi:polyisoprenyl-phosphate glycosyltransferase
MRLVVDSVIAFSDLPIRVCAYVGAALLALSMLIGVIALALLPRLGAVLLLVLAAIAGLTGMQLLALGVVGAYVWRALDESRRRPQYLVERLAGRHPAVPVSSR